MFIMNNKILNKGNILVVLLTTVCSFMTGSQTIEPAFLQVQWHAGWIAVPQTEASAYGVYLFRKSFDLSTIPASFPIYVSADNRYKLYVNENLVSLGPARCDVEHWNFEIVDLAPYLKNGLNIVAAKVWNDGERRAEAQISFRTGFILQGASEESKVLDTDTTWLCIKDDGYSIPQNIGRAMGYSVVPPNEQVDMNVVVKCWAKPDFDDKGWNAARVISRGTPKNTIGIDANKTWRLMPSTLPQMELTYQRFEKVRKSEGVNVPKTFPIQKAPINIPANTKASILLDQTYLTNAYVTLQLKGGKNAVVTMSYAEALYENFSKNNRNEIDGKNLIGGRTDVVIADGSDDQVFTSNWYKTYRYVNLQIVTKDEPLVLEDFFGIFTGYPFKLNAKLNTNDTELNKILEIGWRTARLCAVETYMDCPYYEQLQYIGDTRIQALVSLFNSGDDQPMKSMLTSIDYSRHPEGITLSRYPTVNPQMIPTFTLWYIGMLHDYMMYGGDVEFIKGKIAGERQIMSYFMSFQDSDGSLKNLPNWFYADWANGPGWRRGMGPVGKDGNSAMLDLQLLLAYMYAADLEQEYGMNDYVVLYRSKAKQLSETIKKKYWDGSRAIFADTSDKDAYSQHANSLAILAGLVDAADAKKIGHVLLADTSLTNASIYFKYYLHRALVKAGLGDDYLSWLDIWRKNIELGLTTWAETSNVEWARSDCHAWGSSPNIEFFRTILGIDSSSPNFKEVRIEPHLGKISKIGGEMPHPAGKIVVNYVVIANKVNVEITLPAGISGSFVWKGKSYALKSGENRFSI